MIVVTGATGNLGSLIIEGLLAGGLAAEVAVAVRNPERAASFAKGGIEVRLADYDEPRTLERAFGAGDRVLLISSSQACG